MTFLYFNKALSPIRRDARQVMKKYFWFGSVSTDDLYKMQEMHRGVMSLLLVIPGRPNGKNLTCTFWVVKSCHGNAEKAQVLWFAVSSLWSKRKPVATPDALCVFTFAVFACFDWALCMAPLHLFEAIHSFHSHL